jgi:hypothetical protein
MENLLTETVADQGLKVSVEDETRLVRGPARHHSENVVLKKLTNNDANAVDVEAPGADVSLDLVHRIESLTKDDARARLLELEEDQEKTFFEIGGVLSAIQKHKWFEPFRSLDGWAKKNTAIKRSRARAWIQIYDAIVKSGVTWAKVKHLGWTKLNAIAGVLDGENADHWIEIASNHGRAEIKKLVQEHLAGSVAQKRGESTPAPVKTFEFHLHDERQVEAVDAAIDAAKTVKGFPDDSSALAYICGLYMSLRWRKDGWDRGPDALASVFAGFLNRLDKHAAGEVMRAVHANPHPRPLESWPDRRLIGRASKSSSRLDAAEIVQPAGRRFSRGDQSFRAVGPARAVIGRAEKSDCRVDLGGGFR